MEREKALGLAGRFESAHVPFPLPCRLMRNFGAIVGEESRVVRHAAQNRIARICGIRGIEENTAHYIAMRALGEPDAFPFADRRILGKGGNPLSTPEVLRIAERWRPWRAYAAIHLCAAVAASGDGNKKKLNGCG